jgi:hypothetical protein
MQAMSCHGVGYTDMLRFPLSGGGVTSGYFHRWAVLSTLLSTLSVLARQPTLSRVASLQEEECLAKWATMLLLPFPPLGVL